MIQSIIKAVNSIIKKQKCPIVVDPIIKSTTKTILLKKSAIEDYRKNDNTISNNHYSK